MLHGTAAGAGAGAGAGETKHDSGGADEDSKTAGDDGGSKLVGMVRSNDAAARWATAEALAAETDTPIQITLRALELFSDDVTAAKEWVRGDGAVFSGGVPFGTYAGRWVGDRDEEGWVYDMELTIEPKGPAGCLASIVHTLRACPNAACCGAAPAAAADGSVEGAAPAAHLGHLPACHLPGGCGGMAARLGESAVEQCTGSLVRLADGPAPDTVLTLDGHTCTDLTLVGLGHYRVEVDPTWAHVELLSVGAERCADFDAATGVPLEELHSRSSLTLQHTPAPYHPDSFLDDAAPLAAVGSSVRDRRSCRRLCVCCVSHPHHDHHPRCPNAGEPHVSRRRDAVQSAPSQPGRLRVRPSQRCG